MISLLIKGIVHQFWIYNIFFEPHRKKIFYERFISIKPLWFEIIEKKRVHKVSPCYIYDIYNSTRSDWLCAPFFLNYFEPEWFYRDEPFIKYVYFEKNVIYSKLVNNPFKHLSWTKRCNGQTYGKTKWFIEEASHLKPHKIPYNYLRVDYFSRG